jgi:hypothetical protein
MMKALPGFACTVVALTAFALSPIIYAQAYPTKPIG